MILFIDGLVVFYASMNGYLGLKRGFLEEIGRILGLAFSIIISFNNYLNLSEIISKWTSVNQKGVLIISYLIIFIISIQFFRLISKILQFLFISKSTKMMNKLLGALLGFFKGVMFISIFIWFFELIPNHRISKIILSESKITSQLVNTRTTISEIFYFDKPIRESEKRIEKLIKDRRAIPENQRPDDLLTLLLSSRDPENPDITLTDEQIRDECTTILVAGHETTANAMSWTWYLLSQNPDQGNRLREECKAVLRGRTPTAKDLPSLPLSEKVILESMRLFPPVWFINRIAHEESEIGPYHIGKGAIVVGSAWKMHRDERWWPNPLQFNPDRFTTGHDDNRHRFAYFPFGGGQKKCIGQSFAMIEAQLILISLVQKFAFELVPDHPVVPRPLVTLSPAHGLPMYVKTME